MSSYWEKQRDIKRPYRKKALQSNMSQVKESVDSNPPPQHSYNTATHKKTQPVRPGIDAHTYTGPVRSAVENLEFASLLDQARYPWHLSPKGDSANVIQRNSVTLSLGDNDWQDILVLNVDGSDGTEGAGTGDIHSPESLGGTPGAPGATEVGTLFPELQTDALGVVGDSASTNEFPTASGSSATGVAGTVQRTQPNQIFKIKSFGHSEATYHGTPASNPVTYEIWVDGKLFMSWANFQWAPVSPKSEQWEFDQPITVTQQIVFRIVNQSAGTLSDTISACFAGWSETLDGYQDLSHTQIEQT